MVTSTDTCILCAGVFMPIKAMSPVLPFAETRNKGGFRDVSFNDIQMSNMYT